MASNSIVMEPLYALASEFRICQPTLHPINDLTTPGLGIG